MSPKASFIYWAASEVALQDTKFSLQKPAIEAVQTLSLSDLLGGAMPRKGYVVPTIYMAVVCLVSFSVTNCFSSLGILSGNFDEGSAV